MFNAGSATMYVDIQNVTTTLDAQGAPVRSYTSYLQCFAATEQMQYNANNTDSTGPREESVKTLTLIIRNHASLDINTRQRVVDTDTGDIYHITAIRYDMKQTTCYLDVQSGVSDG